MKIIFFAIAALAAIVGSAFFLGIQSSSPPEATPITNVISSSGESPWIEVLQGKVFEFDKNGKLIKELKTGDTLEEGRTVDASTGALANIYFVDGSILKIDSETKIELQKSGVWLAVGRVFSQIKNLATINSEWQVETPNAVAAVRGTAFGVEFTKGKSIVVVLENKVEVAAKDPISHEIIESSKTIVSEKEFVAVDEKDLLKIKAEKRTLKIEKAGSELLNRAWIKRATEAKKPAETKKIEETKKVENTITPLELKIINKTSLEKIFEGENVKFEALLVLSNGSEKLVTSEVTWQTLGGIGTTGKDGIFLPKLDPSVSEFGSAFGNIVAVWKDKTTGKEFLGKTPIFKVGARIIEEEIQNSIEPRG